ncbi:hypothetical protein ES707_19223 [subsurface metagenome]
MPITAAQLNSFILIKEKLNDKKDFMVGIKLANSGGFSAGLLWSGRGSRRAGRRGGGGGGRGGGGRGGGASSRCATIWWDAHLCPTGEHGCATKLGPG